MAVNKVNYSGRTLIDLTSDTVEARFLKKGVTAHDNTGNSISGTAIVPTGIKMVYENFDIHSDLWRLNSKYKHLPYLCALSITGVTSDYIPMIIFESSCVQILRSIGINIGIAETAKNYVYIFASDKPTTTIHIDRIEFM